MTNKGLMEHLKDIKDGIVDCYIGLYDFGDFLARISGFRDWQEKSVILDDFHKRQTLEELDFLKDIIKNETSRNIILEYLIKDVNERPLYYLAPSGIFTTIKKITKTKKLFIINITSLGGKATSTAHSLYPYYKNIQNSFTPLCSIDNKNSNLLKEFNFDSFSCNFYNNNIFNQSLKHLNNIQNEKEYINEYKIFLENLNYFSQEYNNYKLVSIQAINNLKIAYIQKLSLENINNINIDSKPYLLKALYFCEDYVLYDKDKQALFDENTIKELEFNSSFYTIFISHKNKLNDTYLNTRKELYKSIDEFKKLGFEDLENAYQTYINSLIVNKEINSKDETINKNKNKEINKNLNQDENSNQESDTKENTSSTKEQDFYLLSSHSKNLNHFILENKDKNKKIIFLNNASSMSNLIHIYDNHCDVFIKNESLLDIKRIEKEYNIKFKEFNTRVFFYEKLLLGAKENNEFSFEDKEENLLYYFKYDKEDLNSLGDLNIKYNNHNAKIKNYSLLEESLNIKLEPKELKKEIAYNNTSFNKISKEPLNESSSGAKEPCFITLYLKDEHNKPIANAKIIIKGFKHDEALRVVNLKRRSDEKGKIRFDKEKYFSDCYSFKVKLDESKAYFPTPLQNAKRIFNNYTHHKVGLILKFKAKDHLVYDGFNLYHYKGNELINSYMARSGTAKADNQKRSKKQIAHYFYQDEKDKSKSGKAYFYYDDESIKDRFGTLPEGEYYLKINEIAKDTKPNFLKDYPFEIGKTWGRYCVRLYTDKECSKTFKEVKIKESNEKENKTSKKDKKEQSIIKDNLYLYSINEKGEFGSNGSIGIAQAQLLEDLSKQAKFVRSEGENIISLKVAYPEKIDNKIIFVGKVYE
ncbi:hypothetical protein [Campylobacter jejuni]|uniref:hypothetical protein n=1 Tax=Campylobacter jejuni TaxID=197 RepID=UPI000AB68017|nr:hypothetical protein [Campylobacter jejuni]